MDLLVGVIQVEMDRLGVGVQNGETMDHQTEWVEDLISDQMDHMMGGTLAH